MHTSSVPLAGAAMHTFPRYRCQSDAGSWFLSPLNICFSLTNTPCVLPNDLPGATLIDEPSNRYVHLSNVFALHSGGHIHLLHNARYGVDVCWGIRRLAQRSQRPCSRFTLGSYLVGFFSASSQFRRPKTPLFYSVACPNCLWGLPKIHENVSLSSSMFPHP
jgi:hypothetical protein